MPIYEFACERCGEPFEELVLRPSAYQQDIRCPKCGSQAVRKKVSLFSSRGSGPSAQAAACTTSA